MSDTTYPPLADGGPTLTNQLGQAEKKRSGHIYDDCALYGLPAPKGKAKPCDECVARYRITATEARAHQQAFDAQWRAAQADPGTRTVGRGTGYEYQVTRDEPVVDRYEAVVDVPPARQRSNKFAGRCSTCGYQVAANAGLLSGRPGAWVTTHRPGECPEAQPKAPEAPVVTANVPAGLYALDTEEGAKNAVAFYRVDHGKEGTRWEGFVFLSRLVGGNPDIAIKGGAKASILARLAEDPEGASRRFGRESGRCGRCNTLLTDDASRAEGIGPVCATKGW